MSAFVQEPEHLAYLVAAGLEVGARGGSLSWFAGPIDDPDLWTERGQALQSADRMAVIMSMRRTLTHETADAVMLMLHAENVRSVNHRYDEHAFTAPPSYSRPRLALHLPWVMQAIDGYEYQACEAPEWARSEARQYCDALRRAWIRRIPGMSDAPTWAITRSTIAEHGPRAGRRAVS